MDDSDIPQRTTRKDRSDAATAPKRAYTRRAKPESNGVDGPVTIESIEQQLAGGGLSRKARGRLARMKRQMLMEADNPFVNERPGVFPQLPLEEDPEHAYHWVRTEEPGRVGGDRSNLHKKSTGPLRYEFVKAEDLPEHWRPLVQAFVMPDGTIGYRDTLLARCSRRVREQRLARMETQADQMSDRVNAGYRDAIRQIGGGQFEPRVDTDLEEAEVRDVYL